MIGKDCYALSQARQWVHILIKTCFTMSYGHHYSSANAGDPMVTPEKQMRLTLRSVLPSKMQDLGLNKGRKTQRTTRELRGRPSMHTGRAKGGFAGQITL